MFIDSDGLLLPTELASFYSPGRRGSCFLSFVVPFFYASMESHLFYVNRGRDFLKLFMQFLISSKKNLIRVLKLSELHDFP